MILWKESANGYRMTLRKMEEACAAVAFAAFFGALAFVPLWSNPASAQVRRSALYLGPCALVSLVLAGRIARRSWWIDIPLGGKVACWGEGDQAPSETVPVLRFDVEQVRSRTGSLSYHLVAVLADGGLVRPLGTWHCSSPQPLARPVRQLNDLLGIDPASHVDLPDLVVSHRRETMRSCFVAIALALGLVAALGLLSFVASRSRSW